MSGTEKRGRRGCQAEITPKRIAVGPRTMIGIQRKSAATSAPPPPQSTLHGTTQLSPTPLAGILPESWSPISQSGIKSMIDSERFKLRYGPYLPPKCRIGDKLLCEYRDREVTVRGVTGGRIQWPCARGPGPQGPIVCGSLIQAVRTESAIAVAFHWGVCVKTVTKWRRALEVPVVNNGTLSLYVAYGYERLATPENKAKTKEAAARPEVREKLRASHVGRPAHPKTAAALLEAASRPKTEAWKRGLSARSRKMWENAAEFGLRPQHAWSDEDIALLGTKSDKSVGEILGLPQHVVVYKRKSLGIEANVLEPWQDDEIRLLGTTNDSGQPRHPLSGAGSGGGDSSISPRSSGTDNHLKCETSRQILAFGCELV